MTKIHTCHTCHVEDDQDAFYILKEKEYCEICVSDALPEGKEICWKCNKELADAPQVGSPPMGHPVCDDCAYDWSRYLWFVDA